MPVIHPASENILVGYAKPDKIGSDLPHSSFMLFLHKNSTYDLRRALRITAISDVLQRDAFIVNVIDEQHRLTAQLQMRCLEPFQLTTMLSAPIATDVAIIHYKITAKHPREPNHRDHATHQDPD